MINIRPPRPPGVWHAQMWTDLSFYCRFQFASMRTPINVLIDMMKDPILFDDHSYSMIPAIQWSPAIRWSSAIRWSPAIWWSIGSMDFDNPKVYSDTPSLIVLFFRNGENFGHSESLYCDNIELSILIIQGIPPFQPIQQSHPRGRSGRWKGQIAKWENLASQFSELVQKVILMARPKIMIRDQGSGKGGVHLDPLPI